MSLILTVGIHNMERKHQNNVYIVKTLKKLEALGKHRPPPSGAVAGACAKTCFNLAFRLYRRELMLSPQKTLCGSKSNFTLQLQGP